MTRRFLYILRSLIDENTGKCDFKHTSRCLIDYLSCVIAGSKEFASKNAAYLSEMSSEVGNCTVFGQECLTTMQTSALLNGMSAHVLELDDGHRRGALHVGASVFSALLAVAEKEKLSSRDFLLGATIGYEATIRLACAVQPGNKLRGYHATGTCGTLGAALGVAAALHFDEEQMMSTLSAAVTSAAGLLEMQEDGSDFKPLNVGRAAMDAVSAAYLGKVRFRAPDDALGGKRGFLKVMTDEPHPEYLTDPDIFGKGHLAIQDVYLKTYASCRHTHPAIEAALYLRKWIMGNQMSLDVIRKSLPTMIKSINVDAYKLAVFGHDHTDVHGIGSAKMSMPFSVALAICEGSAGMEMFTEEMLTDEVIQAVAKKVTVSEDERLSALVPVKRASVLTVTMNDGRTFSHRVDYPKGEPENPLTEQELEQKFVSLTAYAGVSEKIAKEVLVELRNYDFNMCDLLSQLNTF